MNDYNKIYEQLKQTYTDEEIADFAMIPNISEQKEAEKARIEFVQLRLALRKNQSAKEKILSSLLNIKYQIKKYINNSDLRTTNNFGAFLIQYIKSVNRTQKEFANDINIHPSRLNRIIKGKERISKKLAYRLEQHSGTIIPAIYWWKLMQKEVEAEILNETTAREVEKKQVKFVAYTIDV